MLPDIRSFRTHFLNLVSEKYHNLRGGVTTITIGDESVAYHRDREHGGHKIRWRAETEAAPLQALANAIGEESIVWDVGANIGPHAMLAGRLAREVHAFEPTPQNAAQLRQNIAANSLENVTVHECVLAANEGTAMIRDAAVGDGTPSIGDGDLSVPQYPGDDLVSEIPPPDVVKIDVEGSEARVIEGLSETLADHASWVFLEVHHEAPNRADLSDFDASVADIRATMRELGFKQRVEWERATETQTAWTQRQQGSQHKADDSYSPPRT